MTVSLLDLPAELRLRIYDFVLSPIIPLSAPPSQYNGLLYSCHHIQHELSSELLKRMTAFLYSLQRKCRAVNGEIDFNFTPPQSLDQVYNLTVSRPDLKKLFNRDDPFMALMYMHLNTLTITTLLPSGPLAGRRPQRNVDAAEQYRFQRNTRLLARWIGSQDGNLPAAKRILYDWVPYPQLERLMYTRDIHNALERRDVWGMRYWREQGMAVKAEFVRLSEVPDQGGYREEEPWRRKDRWAAAYHRFDGRITLHG